MATESGEIISRFPARENIPFIVVRRSYSKLRHQTTHAPSLIRTEACDQIWQLLANWRLLCSLKYQYDIVYCDIRRWNLRISKGFGCIVSHVTRFGIFNYTFDLIAYQISQMQWYFLSDSEVSHRIPYSPSFRLEPCFLSFSLMWIKPKDAGGHTWAFWSVVKENGLFAMYKVKSGVLALAFGNPYHIVFKTKNLLIAEGKNEAEIEEHWQV